jgi:hypothetical protein
MSANHTSNAESGNRIANANARNQGPTKRKHTPDWIRRPQDVLWRALRQYLRHLSAGQQAPPGRSRFVRLASGNYVAVWHRHAEQLLAIFRIYKMPSGYPGLRRIRRASVELVLAIAAIPCVPRPRTET